MFGELELLRHDDGIGRAIVVQVVQLGADAQEVIVGAIELAALAFVEQLFFDQAGRGLDALLEEGDPEQVLVVAQAAAAVLDVRLLHVDGVAEFLVALGLVADTVLDVLVLVADHAALDELAAKFLEKLLVAGDEAGLEQRGLGKHVGVGLLARHRRRSARSGRL